MLANRPTKEDLPPINSQLRRSAAKHYPALVLTGEVVKSMLKQIKIAGDRFIHRVSNTKSVFKVRHEEHDYLVVYCKTRKSIKEFIDEKACLPAEGDE